MTANRMQASLSQQLAASTTSRRRSVPPSPPGLMSQSLNQRWRERPRCPALPVTPGRRDGVVHAIVGRAACHCPRAHVTQDKRAARAHVCGSRFAGTMRPTERTEIGSFASHVFQGGTSRLQIQIQTSHHRAFHAGAVLGIVNALRCASTRPTAGPSGIDDASARHMSGSFAMVGTVSITRTDHSNGLDEGIVRAYLGVIASVPHGTPSVRLKGQRSAHPVGALRARHRAQSSTHRGPVHDDRGRLVGTPMSCEPRDLLAAHHPQDHAPRRGCVHQRRCVALV